jgi:hypothetical protein
VAVELADIDGLAVALAISLFVLAALLVGWTTVICVLRLALAAAVIAVLAIARLPPPAVVSAALRRLVGLVVSRASRRRPPRGLRIVGMPTGALAAAT